MSKKFNVDLMFAFIILEDLGVTGIKIYYAGGGDSGCIEEITCVSEKNVYRDENNVIVDIDCTQEAIIPISEKLKDVIEDNIYPVLDDLEDWYNNDGGFGNVYIDIKTGYTQIDNNINILTTEQYIHEKEITFKDF